MILNFERSVVRIPKPCCRFVPYILYIYAGQRIQFVDLDVLGIPYWPRLGRHVYSPSQGQLFIDSADHRALRVLYGISVSMCVLLCSKCQRLWDHYFDRMDVGMFYGGQETIEGTFI
jgi:hypothetical protein